jgi:hypothetical protein
MQKINIEDPIKGYPHRRNIHTNPVYPGINMDVARILDESGKIWDFKSFSLHKVE